MRRALPLVLVLVLIAVACGDDDSTSSAPPTTAEPTGLASDGDGATPDSDEESECEALARAAAPAQAPDSFTDYHHITWAVAGTSTDEAGRAVVEVVPTPDDVGYPRFRFVSRCDGDDVVFLGSYALDGGAWVLLFTTDEPGASDLVSG